MNRRLFLGFSLAAVGGVFVPKYGRWYRQGSGVLVPNTDWIMNPDMAEWIGSPPSGWSFTVNPYIRAADVAKLSERLAKDYRTVARWPTTHLTQP